MFWDRKANAISSQPTKELAKLVRARRDTDCETPFETRTRSSTSMLLSLCSLTLAGRPAVYDAMLQHIVHCGGMVGPVAIRPSKMGYGFGCFTTREVAEDEMLFIVPASLQISAPTAQIVGGNDLSMTDAAAIAGFMALSQLSNCPKHSPYLATLPLKRDDSIVWWSDREMALLDGTLAYNEAIELRAEADAAVCNVLRNKPLRTSYGLALSEADDLRLSDAVRAAYSCVVSRAFGSADAAAGHEMVPLLDMMQHGGAACSVSYSDEVTDEVFETASDEECDAILNTPNHPDLCCEVRSTRRLAAGTELTTDYGPHPAFVFGTHYMFTVASDESYQALADAALGEDAVDGAPYAAALEAMGTCALQLRLSKTVIPATAPTEWTLRGQNLALAAMEASVFVETSVGKAEWLAGRTNRRIANAGRKPFREFVHLLASTDSDAIDSFVVTCSQIEDAARLALEGRRPQEGGEALDALLCCARLWVLDEIDVRQICAQMLGAGGLYIAPDQVPSPKAWRSLVLSSLMSRSAQLSRANDQRAAALLVALASQQIAELDLSTPPAAAALDVRPECWNLAHSLRGSERAALVWLRDSASRLFPEP